MMFTHYIIDCNSIRGLHASRSVVACGDVNETEYTYTIHNILR